MLCKAFIGIVKVYKFAISPILPGRCRFYPSCSDFAIDALNKFGAFGGAYCALRRILRCHPFNAGGFDFAEDHEKDYGVKVICALRKKT